MGGKVFPGLTRRFDREEYFSYVPEILEKLKSITQRASLIEAYADKTSFGDMDVLYIPSIALSKTILESVFETKHVSRNGDVYSLVYKEMQVDLIKSNKAEFDYAKNYFNYNDLGNLRGRLAHKLGLTHGHNGLIMKVRSNDHILGEIILTQDPSVVEEFLDVKSGPFNTLVDIFNNVINSSYFNPEIFKLENRNHTARIRDRKRPTYTAFLEYIKDIEKPKFSQTFYVYNPDKTVYHDLIFSKFPHVKAQFDALWEKKRINEEASLKFNGRLVSEWTGRVNKDLGELMRYLKQTLTPEMILSLSEDDLKLIVQLKNKLL